MTHKSKISAIVTIMAYCGTTSAQKLLDRANQAISPSEQRYSTSNTDFLLEDEKTLYSNPIYPQWRSKNDSAYKSTAIIYAGMSGADGKGDFIPYEGNKSDDYRIGAYGEYCTPRSGTLSGTIQYAKGTHKNIGWSAMRLPELYFPYISTDSCGGDYKFDSYYAEGNYGLTLRKWTLGVKGSFYGEQAYRLTDPRALNNTTWLRFNIGAARQIGKHLLMLDAGYGRNKQHMQLRYWRPGQQDRFFVCYGFGLYDTRQSGVSFGKSRMYYINEYNARFQYLSPRGKKLSVHAAVEYSSQHMTTEESDIYNLYESKTQNVNPMIQIAYNPHKNWIFDIMATANISRRKGYENIIEEYLIDRENNIYDFQTIDTRQYYSRNTSMTTATIRAERRIGNLGISLQGGMATHEYKEKYKAGGYIIKVQTLTPHAKTGINWWGKKDCISLNVLYAHQSVGNHSYCVDMQNQKIPHLDFQHAFSPYAFRCANLNIVTSDITWQHKFNNISAGINAKLYIANGKRKDEVSYNGTIGFQSTAPMISPTPDKHKEQWAAITLFVIL